MPCRCGFDESESGDHPCHARGYTCRKPAKLRFYGPKTVALAGVQLKFEVSSTWACDECWEKYLAMMKKEDPAGSEDAPNTSEQKDDA